jgi:hypothetical protein
VHFCQIPKINRRPEETAIRRRIIYGRGWSSFATRCRLLSRYPAKSDFRLWRELSRRRRLSIYIRTYSVFCFTFTLKRECNLNANCGIFLYRSSMLISSNTLRARALLIVADVYSSYSWSCITSWFPKKLNWFDLDLMLMSNKDRWRIYHARFDTMSNNAHERIVRSPKSAIRSDFLDVALSFPLWSEIWEWPVPIKIEYEILPVTSRAIRHTSRLNSRNAIMRSACACLLIK